MAVLHAVQQRLSSGLKNHRSPWFLQQAFPPDLPLSAPSCNLRPPPLFFFFPAEPEGMCAQRKQLLKVYLPVRGGSVNVRTKRREKRTKLLLSAFGNIYPPFIVTPLFRKKIKNCTEDLQQPPPPPSPDL